MWANGSPWMVTPSSVAQVKSVCMASPGTCSWGKEDLLVGAVLGPPDLDPPLEGPQLAFVVDPRTQQHQVLEQGPGLERGRQLQPLLDLRPVRRERVRPRIPGPGPFQVGRELDHLEIFPGRVPVHPDAERRHLHQPSLVISSRNRLTCLSVTRAMATPSCVHLAAVQTCHEYARFSATPCTGVVVADALHTVSSPTVGSRRSLFPNHLPAEGWKAGLKADNLLCLPEISPAPSITTLLIEGAI